MFRFDALGQAIVPVVLEEGDAVLEEAAREELQNVEFLDDPMGFASEI